MLVCFDYTFIAKILKKQTTRGVTFEKVETGDWRLKWGFNDFCFQLASIIRLPSMSLGVTDIPFTTLQLTREYLVSFG